MFKRAIKSLGVSVVFAICFFALVSNGMASIQVFIDEIHYDNDGVDTGEFVEIFGPTETDLSGWKVELYNGNGGALYNTIDLTGSSFPDQLYDHGTLAFSQAGIQNGDPDGLALVDNDGAVIQFLSYEGTFMATSGTANGLTSTDIGVFEPGDTPVGKSLQLVGMYSSSPPYYYENFTWTDPIPETPGEINTGAVPIPGAVWLLGSGLVGIVGIRRKLRS